MCTTLACSCSVFVWNSASLCITMIVKGIILNSTTQNINMNFCIFFKNGETFQKKVKQEGKRDLHHRHDDTPASTRQQVSAVKLIEFSYFKPFTSKI